MVTRHKRPRGGQLEITISLTKGYNFCRIARKSIIETVDSIKTPTSLN
jgi:hypothetical protein